MSLRRLGTPSAGLAVALLQVGIACVVTHAAPGEELRLRELPVKPRRVVVGEHHLPDRVWVTFAQGLSVDVHDGALTDGGTADLREARTVLNALDNCRWSRRFPIDRARLQRLRHNAEQQRGVAMPDLTLQFNLILDVDLPISGVIDALNGLACVELAEPAPRPVIAPLPPDFRSEQGYKNPGPVGIGAEIVWEEFGVTGEGIKVVDIEFDWNFAHLDLSASLVGPEPQSPLTNNHHGTASLGVIAGIDNGWGITGIAPGVEPFGAAVAFEDVVWDPGLALLNTLETIGRGDVVFIEQQTLGPKGVFTPVEWHRSVYTIFQFATASGITVVEPAGNFGTSLDDAIFSEENFGHWPFLPGNDSGAIMVGAGASPMARTDVPRSRLGFSNYGSRLDVQAWGETVWTTGYGDAWDREGADLLYTSTFSGTSSASAIMAGACVLMQSAFKNEYGYPLSPGAVRSLFRDHSWPQQAGRNPVSEHIGPLPDLPAAIGAAIDDCVPIQDCNRNGADDLCDIAHDQSLDCNENAIPDECDIASGVADCDGNGVPDSCDLDCDGNGQPDACDVAGGAPDCDGNGVPDACDPDCDGNGQPDTCDIADGLPDCDADGVPDVCEDDCNRNGAPDACDIADGTSADDNGNNVPDECDPLSNDSCGSAQFVPLGSTPFTTGDATTDGPAEDLCNGHSQFIQNDAWFRYLNIACEKSITINVCDTDFDPVIVVYTNQCPTDADQAHACSDTSCNSGSEVTFDAEPFTIYRVRIGSPTGSAGTGVFVITQECLVPKCPTDTNSSGTTDIDDLIAVILDWGTDGKSHDADVDESGTVDCDDLVEVIMHWGPCPI